MPGGRPRLQADHKAVRTSISLTKETHDRAVTARLSISSICEAALRQRLNRYALLPEIQKSLMDELISLENELEPKLSDNQRLKLAKVRNIIDRLEGDAFIVKDK
jgi:hypothetical protein